MTSWGIILSQEVDEKLAPNPILERAPPVAVKRLANVEFYATPQQQALIELLDGKWLAPGKTYEVKTPADPEETRKVCVQLNFSLPIHVVCERGLVTITVPEYIRGYLILHTWYRAQEGKKQEFLEMGVLFTECVKDCG
ncbi:MAG: hypothetical protein ACTS8S_00850 [Giesbergeria sp.]